MPAPSNIVQFPTPLPPLTQPQDVGQYTDELNQIIRYINTIVYGDNYPSNVLFRNQNLADLASIPTALANLGIKSAGTMSSTSFDAAGAAASAQAAGLQKSQNFADVPNKSVARANLNLGSASTHAYGDFDPAGAAAGRAAQGVNSDITALTALSVLTNLTTNHLVVAGNQTLEVNAASGPVSIIYPPGTAAGRVLVVKTDATYNPVNITNGTSAIYALVSPAMGANCQSVTVYTNTSATKAV